MWAELRFCFVHPEAVATSHVIYIGAGIFLFQQFIMKLDQVLQRVISGA